MYEIQRIGKVMWTEIIQVLIEMIIHLFMFCVCKLHKIPWGGWLDTLVISAKLEGSSGQQIIFMFKSVQFMQYTIHGSVRGLIKHDTIMNPSTCKCCLEQKHKGVLFGIVGKSSLFSQSVAQVYNCHLSVSY